MVTMRSRLSRQPAWQNPGSSRPADPMPAQPPPRTPQKPPSRAHYRLVETPQGVRAVAPDAVVTRPRAEAPARWQAWLKLIRFDRPIGTLLLLWPTLWGLWFAAEGAPPIGLLAIFAIGAFLTRSAGCVINDYADRWLDPHVERTRTRPLAAGEVGSKEALAIFVVLMLIAFGLVLLTNTLTVILAVLAAALAASYPYMKRIIWFPQVVLGAAFSMGIPMAYTAVRGELDAIAVLLYCANLLWTTAYDTLYAMVDREDDIKAGSRSTAILFGELDLVAVGILHGSALLTLALAGYRAELSPIYFIGLLVAAAVMGWQLWIARGRERAACFRAFLANNWVGAAVFAGTLAHYAANP
jgi:4-hydroxybenzoate polyprenyltransferase